MQMSGITDSEYVRIISSFYAMTEERVNCEACLARKNSEAKRRIQGCHGVSENVIFPTKYIKYRSCIGNYRDESFSSLLTLHKLWQNGNNPFGSLEDTPAKVVEIFNLLDNLFAEKRAEEAKKK